MSDSSEKWATLGRALAEAAEDAAKAFVEFAKAFNESIKNEEEK